MQSQYNLCYNGFSVSKRNNVRLCMKKEQEAMKTITILLTKYSDWFSVFLCKICASRPHKNAEIRRRSDARSADL